MSLWWCADSWFWMKEECRGLETTPKNISTLQAYMQAKLSPTENCMLNMTFFCFLLHSICPTSFRRCSSVPEGMHRLPWHGRKHPTARSHSLHEGSREVWPCNQLFVKLHHNYGMYFVCSLLDWGKEANLLQKWSCHRGRDIQHHVLREGKDARFWREMHPERAVYLWTPATWRWYQVVSCVCQITSREWVAKGRRWWWLIRL